MPYLISFLEGIVTFIYPCLLPMLPVYISYFAGGEQDNKRRALKVALGLVRGFTVGVTIMGAFAGTLGALLRQYQTAINIVTGLIVILFGLHFLGVFKIALFKGGPNKKVQGAGFFSSLLFGLVFSVGWTPCVGAFLGSALMLASQQGSTLKGVLMLLCYSAGLGVPFIISAVLIGTFKSLFDFIKRHYRVIHIVCGAFLVVVGILMMTGLFGRFLSFLSIF